MGRDYPNGWFANRLRGYLHVMSTSAPELKESVMAKRRARPHPGQQAAASVGAVFLLVGLLGFLPGVTVGLSSLAFAGQDSGATLLGIFRISILHNILHLAFGVAGLRMARTLLGARRYLLAGGAIYLLLWLYGILIDLRGGGNFMPVNEAGNWLHLAFGVGMLALGALTVRALGKVKTGTVEPK